MLIKKSLALGRHRTSVALEQPFWDVLADLAASRGLPMARLVEEIDRTRGEAPLASALRLAALSHARQGAPSTDQNL